MSHFRTAGLAVVMSLSAASEVLSQRQTNTGQATVARRWELGVQAMGVSIGLDDPRSIELFVPGATLTTRLWFKPALAVDVDTRLSAKAQKGQTGSSSHAFDIGLVYGLQALSQGETGTFIRPALTISGGSGGSSSRTTVSGAFGMRRKFHGVTMENQFRFNRLLESGNQAAESFLTATTGFLFFW
jgi:hypothetical protein